MTDVRTDPLAERYGVPSPRRRRTVALVCGLVGLVALTWLGWVMWSQGNPEVQSSLRSFDVVDTHAATAEVAVRPRAGDVSATCLLRAFAEDHSVVGERNFTVSGVEGTVVRTLSVRTEREATSVELIGCRAEGQSRYR